MPKRAHEDAHDAYTKRQKHSSRYDDQYSKQNQPHIDRIAARAPQVPQNSVLPPATTLKTLIPTFVPFTTKAGLPDLPPISEALAGVPFRHKSRHYDRSSTVQDVTYERLEFLGDAYLEVVASRLIYHHFPHLTAGHQSQLREALVKNETLAEYARGYGFVDRLDMGDKETMLKEAATRGNKGINKILGDCLEAYTAAVVLSDAEHGFAVAEKWLTALWTPKVVEHARSNFNTSVVLTSDAKANPLDTYDPTAKATLQQKLLAPGIKLEYEPYRKSEELRGAQLGQNRHYIAVYLTGYGYEHELLGQGEGKNKVEAGNWAATQAMHGKSSSIVAGCAKELAAIREARRQAAADPEAYMP